MIEDTYKWSVSIFVIKDYKKVLLIKHKELAQWLPIGGKIKGRESPGLAAYRELTEETGVTNASFPQTPFMVTGSPRGLLAYEAHPAGNTWHRNFAFMCHLVEGTIITPNKEYEDYKFFDSNELRNLGGMDCPTNVMELSHRAIKISESSKT